MKADTHHGYAPNKQMFLLALKARIVAGAMKILGLDHLDGKPAATREYPADKSKEDKHARCVYLRRLATEIVDKYIIDAESHRCIIDAVLNQAEQEEELQMQMTMDGRFPCRHAGCHKTFKYEIVNTNVVLYKLKENVRLSNHRKFQSYGLNTFFYQNCKNYKG